jgi:hypothetical protein
MVCVARCAPCRDTEVVAAGQTRSDLESRLDALGREHIAVGIRMSSQLDVLAIQSAAGNRELLRRCPEPFCRDRLAGRPHVRVTGNGSEKVAALQRIQP